MESVSFWTCNRTKPPPSDSVYGTIPTFAEFVSYLVATEEANYNIHWLPIHLLCRPCSLHYTIIAKTETIDRDSRKFAFKSNVLNLISIINRLFRFIRKTLGHDEEEEKERALEKMHKTKKVSSGENSLLPSQRFFSLLKRKDVEGLVQKYQIDLDMWGYSPQQYLDWATMESWCTF